MQDSEGLKFILLKEGKDTGITFRAVPGGHEFTSLLMAVLNADGKGKNFPDEFITRRIKALQGPISLTTYLSHLYQLSRCGSSFEYDGTSEWSDTP